MEPDTAGNAGLFFYHSDQIGSTAYVTDDSARVAQFVTCLWRRGPSPSSIPPTRIFPTSLAPRNWTTSLAFTTMGARSRGPRFANWLSRPAVRENIRTWVRMYVCMQGIRWVYWSWWNGLALFINRWEWQWSYTMARWRKTFYIDEDGNSLGILFQGQKEEVVITPTQEQKQDIKEKRAEEQDRNIKKYWHDKAENSDSWEAKFGYWLKSKGGYDVDEKFSEAASTDSSRMALRIHWLAFQMILKQFYRWRYLWKWSDSVDKRNCSFRYGFTLGLSSKLMNVPVSIAKEVILRIRVYYLFSVRNNIQWH